MKKHNSSEFQGIKPKIKENNDININLWDFEGSSFFIDNKNNSNHLESKENLDNMLYNNNNNNINIIYSKKNIDNEFHDVPVNKKIKNKNKSFTTSYDKSNINVSERKTTNVKNVYKNAKNINPKKSVKKNNSFCCGQKMKNVYSKKLNRMKPKKVCLYINKKDIEQKEQKILNSMNNHEENMRNNFINKRNKLKKSLSIEAINKKPLNYEDNNDTKDKNVVFYNKKKPLKKSCSIENNLIKNSIIVQKNQKSSDKKFNNNKTKKKIEQNVNNHNNRNSAKPKKNTSINKRRDIIDAQRYTNYLSKKKIFTQNYELQNKLKKVKEEKDAEKEMLHCTFKPQLYSNKYNNKIQKNNNNKSLYEKQSKWLNDIHKKNENEREKKKNKEIQGCTFNPKLSTLPKYNINSKTKISNRAQIVEENYYNKMKKARQISSEKNKTDDLIEKYDERIKRRDSLQRSMVTFGNLNQDNSIIYEESSNYYNKSNFGDNNIVELKNTHNNNYNFFNDKNNQINNNIRKNIFVLNNLNKNNYIQNQNINNNIKNNITSDNPPNSINTYSNNIQYIITNNSGMNHENYIKTNITESNRKENNNITFNNDTYFNDNSTRRLNYQITNNNPLNINSNYKYRNSRDNNNYDFDNNLTDEKMANKAQSKVLNNILTPTIHNEEQEKENTNISTGTVTKANSILSFQKKNSTHSLPDKNNPNESPFINRLNNYKIKDNQDFSQIIKNNILMNQDDEFNKQKRLLMNELHNWNNYDEESNEA